MRYGLEFKLECVEVHRRGIWKETPERVKTNAFRTRVREWGPLEKIEGIKTFRSKTYKPKFTTGEKLEVVQKKTLNGFPYHNLRQWKILTPQLSITGLKPIMNMGIMVSYRRKKEDQGKINP